MFFVCLKLLASFLAFMMPLDKQEYVYKKVGTTGIDLIVYQPTYNTSAINGLASPVLLAIHGGAFVCGEKDGEGALSERQIKEFSSRGWTVVSINYRLAPAFLSETVEDMQDAYKWIKNKLPRKNPSPVNPDLICVFGRSAGGGLALIGGKNLHPRFPCIISFFPYGSDMLDPEFYDPTTPPSHKLAAAVKGLKKTVTIEFPHPKPGSDRAIVFDLILKEKKGGWLLSSHDPKVDPAVVREKLKEWSPISHIDQHYPPTWIGHGLNDAYVSYNQSVKMKEKLEKHNRVVVLDAVPDGPHGFDRLESESIWKDHVISAFDWAAIQIQNYKRE